ncbi:MAG TPA: PDDEXK nuclease domain-containing protein [Pirellulales bacterium]
MSKKKPHALAGYAGLFKEIKSRIGQAQTRAMLSVNAEMVRLYWDIGRMMHERQVGEGYGTRVIRRLADDLRNDLPDLRGFSERNLGRMIAFFRAYPQHVVLLPQAVAKVPDEILPQAVAKPLNSLLWLIPWGHHAVLLEKVKDLAHRVWYMEQTLANGWSRNVLTMMIKSGAHSRQGKAITNFDRLLPGPQSDLAQQTLKDPYIFDFLTLSEPFRERELELSLLLHVERFLLELGQGFAFVGRQYRITIGDEEFSIDLLFYHLKLRSFVVIDLKTGAFKAEYAGKMNLYLGAIDDQLRHATDSPTVGLILCQDRNRVVAEYALRGMTQPIGVSEYELTRVLPREFESSLPSIDEIEAELAGPATNDRPAKRRPVKKKVKRKAAKS